jgi:hypothetical protein
VLHAACGQAWKTDIRTEGAMNHKKRFMMVGVILLSLSVAPALAGDGILYNGSDFWLTRGDGKTSADFSKEPIPAGFFCNRSEPFTQRIVFRGVPLATAEGPLGADTIVQRLDDAVFNRRGVAFTRIQMRALLLESVAPVKTACGSFNVKVRLTGEQPITRMRIVREDESGGRFVAPIAVKVKMSFAPVAGKARERLEIVRNIRFRPTVVAWSIRTEKTRLFEKAGFLLVDTDGDGRPDTYLPGTSNFAAGVRTSGNKFDCAARSHEDPGHEHGTTCY